MRFILLEPEETAAERIALGLARARTICDVMNEPTARAAMEALDGRWSPYGAVLVGSVEDRNDSLPALSQAVRPVPLIVLLEADDADQAQQVQDCGADDVVVMGPGILCPGAMPFDSVALAERVHVLNRGRTARPKPAVTVGSLTIHFDGQDPQVNGENLHLSPREYSLLMALARHADESPARDEAHGAVFGSSLARSIDPMIDIYVSKLRKTLRVATGRDDLIEARQGQGYRLARSG